MYLLLVFLCINSLMFFFNLIPAFPLGRRERGERKREKREKNYSVKGGRGGKGVDSLLSANFNGIYPLF